MVDPATNLGREVPTPREVLEVIRPQLRFAALIGAVIDAGIQLEPAPGEVGDPVPVNPEMVLSGADQCVSDVVFDAIREDAGRSVKTWARDCDKVFDQNKMTTFVGEALNECFNGEPSEAVLDALDLDGGVCELIGHVIRRLAIPLGDSEIASDDRLAGVAARYFQKV